MLGDRGPYRRQKGSQKTSFFIVHLIPYLCFMTDSRLEGSFVGGYSPDLERIHNLLCFNSIFSRRVMGNSLISTSPDYIMEKYFYWIGIEPKVEISVNHHFRIFLEEYRIKWSPDIIGFENVLLYLWETCSVSDIRVSFNKFEKWIGPLSEICPMTKKEICPMTKKGVHPVLYKELTSVWIDSNDEVITEILRDMTITKLGI